MKYSILISSLLAALSLAACDRPTVVNNPVAPVAVPVAVPGPAGPQGATGNSGTDGSKGEPGKTGKTGDGTTVIVTPPPAPEPRK